MNMRTKQLVLKELLEIIELFPQTPIAQHLRLILRPNTDIYNWTDELLLKKVEKYRNELENDKEEDIEEEREYNNFK